MDMTQTRRERLRTATVAEIKSLARRLLMAGGPHAISLRAIARDMGMTAPAIYRYFPSLDALVLELAEDLYDELGQSIQAARAAAAADDPLAQLANMARAFRHWSISHPAEFGLMFGNPVPGVAEFEDGCVTPEHAGARFGAPFLEALAELWRQAPFPTPPVEIIEVRLGQHLRPYTSRQQVEDLPIQIIYAYLSSWTRLYGLVAMEVFGHLQWAVTTVEPMFEIELAGFLAHLSARPGRTDARPKTRPTAQPT
jgi:AcrR family transcriptional regulator